MSTADTKPSTNGKKPVIRRGRKMAGGLVPPQLIHGLPPHTTSGLTAAQRWAMRVDAYPPVYYDKLRPPCIRFRNILTEEVQRKRGTLGIAEAVSIEGAVLHYKIALLVQLDVEARWVEMSIDSRESMMRLASTEMDKCSRAIRSMGMGAEGDQAVLSSIYNPEPYDPPEEAIRAGMKMELPTGLVSKLSAEADAREAREKAQREASSEDSSRTTLNADGPEKAAQKPTRPVSAEDDDAEPEATEIPETGGEL